MAYEKHDWVDGETITEELLDHMEDGIATASATPGPAGPKGETGAAGRDGAKGADGVTPTIGANGNWFIGATDTGKPSRGASGAKGDPGAPGAKGADGRSVTALALTADASGKVTGGTATLSDKTTIPVTVTTATA